MTDQLKLMLASCTVSILVTSGIVYAITHDYVTAQHEQETQELITENDNLMIDLALASKELSGYLVIEETLTDLGASSSQAKAIIQASTAHNISPKF